MTPLEPIGSWSLPPVCQNPQVTVTSFTDQKWHTLGKACWGVGKRYRPHILAKYQFTVQCQNGLRYSGSLEHEGTLDATSCYFDDRWEPTDHSEAAQTFDPQASTNGRFFAPNPISRIVAHWNGKPVQLPALDPTKVGRLAKPLVIVPGWGSDPSDWGVERIASEKTVLGLVHATGYKSGSLPYVMAKMEGLNVNFNPTSPDQGINSNGIYFFQAYADWYQNAVYWSPWGSSQPYSLYMSLSQVLDKHFGTGWRTDPSAQIDVACHSQGCLVVREMLAHVASNSGPSEPCNHIRKILSINSPHFGSPLGDPITPADHQDDLKPLIAGLADNGQTLFSGKLDKSFMDYLKMTARGGAMGLDEGAGFVSRHPYASAASVVLTFGMSSVAGPVAAWLTGALMGSQTEVDMKVTGGYLSPYHITTTVQPKMFGFDVGGTTTTEKKEPTQEGKKLLAVHANGAHLGTTSQWVSDLRSKGYPRRPDGSAVQFLAIWSSNVRGIMGEILGSLGSIVPNSCPQSETDPAVACFAFEDFLWSQVAKMVQDNNNLSGQFADRYFDPTFATTLQAVHDKWLYTSDLLADSSSQKFLTRDKVNNNPEILGVLSDPRPYLIHQALMPNYPYNQVPHGPVQLNLGGKFGGVDLPLKLDHPGASQEGMDLYCALDLSCSQMLASSHLPPLFPTGAPRAASVTAPVVSGTGTTAVTGLARSVSVTGDLQLALQSPDAALQAVSIPDASGKPAVTVGWTPDRGAWVWQAQGNQVQYLGIPGQKGRIVVARTGGAWSVGFASLSTAPAMQPISLVNAAPVKLDVVESVVSPTTFLVGSATPSDVAALHPADSGSLLLMHSETAGDAHNVSRPRISLYNGTKRAVTGLKLRYFFTADPSRNIQVRVSAPQAFPVTVQYLGSGVNLATVDVSNLVVQPGEVLLSPGLELELHYSDWSNWLVFRDWSNNHNYGLPKINDRIQVIDGEGKVLWGAAQQVPTTDAPVTSWGALVASESRNTPYEVHPHLVLENPGQATVVGAHVRYFFRVPVGTTPTVTPFYLPRGRLSVSRYAGNVWTLDWSDSTGLLLPGAKQDLGEFGIRLTNGGVLPELDTALSFQAGPLSANSHVLLLDRMGDTIWGRRPILRPDTIVPPVDTTLRAGDIQVVAWDEGASEANHPKPRLVLNNLSGHTIQRLVVRYFFKGNPAQGPGLESDWYLPKCAAKLLPGAVQWEVRLDCRDMALAPGASYPNSSGMVFGLHWQDWSVWNRAADWSGQNLNATRKTNSHIVVQDADANLIWGQTP